MADPMNSQSTATAPPSTEFDTSAQTGAEPELATEQAALDAQALVDRMVAAGEWPEPALLEKIIEAGDAAVAPLISVVRTYPRGWPEEAPLNHAMAMLSTLRAPAAVPELIEVIRRYGQETGELAVELFGNVGAVAFEPLFSVCRDQAVTGYARINAISAALGAAGYDQSLRARLADVVRPMLADVIERLRQQRNAPKAAAADDLDDETDEDDSEAGLADVSKINGDQDDDQIGDNAPGPQQKDAERELDEYGEVFYLVNDLAALADPGARDLIRTAFAEDMVETFFMNEEFVERQYQRGGEPARESPDWFERYRDRYREHHTARPAPSPRPPRLKAPPREPESEGAALPETVQVQMPLRNAAALGRNEPCWCGSGKKYKKCHLGKDTRN